jgi:hypothetical protein
LGLYDFDVAESPLAEAVLQLYDSEVVEDFIVWKLFDSEVAAFLYIF